jgi:hypothetical protein
MYICQHNEGQQKLNPEKSSISDNGIRRQEILTKQEL